MITMATGTMQYRARHREIYTLLRDRVQVQVPAAGREPRLPREGLTRRRLGASGQQRLPARVTALGPTPTCITGAPIFLASSTASRSCSSS